MSKSDMLKSRRKRRKKVNNESVGLPSLQELQKFVKEKAKERGYRLSTATIGVIRKLPMLAEIQELMNYYRSEFTPDVKEVTEEILGQCFWYLLLYASELGIDLHSALNSAMKDGVPTHTSLTTLQKVFLQSLYEDKEKTTKSSEGRSKKRRKKRKG